MEKKKITNEPLIFFSFLKHIFYFLQNYKAGGLVRRIEWLIKQFIQIHRFFCWLRCDVPKPISFSCNWEYAFLMHIKTVLFIIFLTYCHPVRLVYPKIILISHLFSEYSTFLLFLVFLFSFFPFFGCMSKDKNIRYHMLTICNTKIWWVFSTLPVFCLLTTGRQMSVMFTVGL